MKYIYIVILIMFSSACLQCKVAEDGNQKSMGSKASLNWTTEDEDPYPDISLPIFPKAQDISYAFNSYKGILSVHRVKTVNYKLRMPYPAYDIMNYYDMKLFGEGWVHIKNHSMATSKWSTFQDGTRVGTPNVRRYARAWISKDKKKEFIFFLEYNKKVSEQWNDTLLVHADIRPFFDNTALNKFMDKIHNEGKAQEFYSLLEKYRNEDSNIDYKRAIQENSQNQDLVEYYQILNKMESQIEIPE